MHPVRLFVAVALATVTLSTSSLAQDGSQGSPQGGAQGGPQSGPQGGVPAARSVAVSGAPALAQQAVGVQRLADAPAPLPHPAPFRADTRQNRALMIVGGAGMLTGAIIGGDPGVLISVGGAVVFLWGLYQYLK